MLCSDSQGLFLQFELYFRDSSRIIITQHYPPSNLQYVIIVKWAEEHGFMSHAQLLV